MIVEVLELLLRKDEQLNKHNAAGNALWRHLQRLSERCDELSKDFHNACYADDGLYSGTGIQPSTNTHGEFQSLPPKERLKELGAMVRILEEKQKAISALVPQLKEGQREIGDWLTKKAEAKSSAELHDLRIRNAALAAEVAYMKASSGVQESYNDNVTIEQDYGPDVAYESSCISPCPSTHGDEDKDEEENGADSRTSPFPARPISCSSPASADVSSDIRDPAASERHASNMEHDDNREHTQFSNTGRQVLTSKSSKCSPGRPSDMFKGARHRSYTCGTKLPVVERTLPSLVRNTPSDSTSSPDSARTHALQMSDGTGTTAWSGVCKSTGSSTTQHKIVASGTSIPASLLHSVKTEPGLTSCKKCDAMPSTKAKTAGRSPLKSDSAKECVTTHLPNELALKTDGAQACYQYLSARDISQRRWKTQITNPGPIGSANESSGILFDSWRAVSPDSLPENLPSRKNVSSPLVITPVNTKFRPAKTSVKVTGRKNGEFVDRKTQYAVVDMSRESASKFARHDIVLDGNDTTGTVIPRD
jgi:hypothetical protein